MLKTQEQWEALILRCKKVAVEPGYWTKARWSAYQEKYIYVMDKKHFKLINSIQIYVVFFRFFLNFIPFFLIFFLNRIRENVSINYLFECLFFVFFLVVCFFFLFFSLSKNATFHFLHGIYINAYRKFSWEYIHVHL